MRFLSLVPVLLALVGAAPAQAARFDAVATSASLSLTTTYGCRSLVGLPARSRVSVLTVRLSSIATAVTISWYVAADSAGEYPLTPVTASPIVDIDADANGGFADKLEAILPAGDVAASTVYLCAKTDAGTASLTARLSYADS